MSVRKTVRVKPHHVKGHTRKSRTSRKRVHVKAHHVKGHKRSK